MEKKGRVWDDWNSGDNWNVEKMEKRFLGLRYRATKNPHKSILNKNQWVISSPSFEKIRRFTTFLSTLCNLRTMIWNKLDTNREKSYLEKQNVQKNESRSCKQAQSSLPFDAKTCSIEKISSNINPKKMVRLYFPSLVFLVKLSFEVFSKKKNRFGKKYTSNESTWWKPLM